MPSHSASAPVTQAPPPQAPHPLAFEPREQGVKAIAQRACDNESVWFSIPGEHRNLERSSDFEDFTTRDTEDTSLVSGTPPASSLSNV